MIKSVLLLFTFLVFSFFSIGQKTKGTLVFKNGDTKEGLVKLSGSQEVKFRKNKKEKAVKFDFEKLDYAQIYFGKESHIYKNVLVSGKDSPMVLEEIVKGRVSLYNLFSQGYSVGFAPMGAGGAPMPTGGNFYSINNLYVLKESETNATHLGSNQLFTKNFKAAASEFFKDCPTLVDKIQNKEFKKKEIKAIVEFYNSHCQ